ncbi:MAG: zinc-ribbon domain-containing protein [Candidatus Baldrarchaeia archaeon]
MPSWGRAFVVAIKVFLVGLIWAIIGQIIIWIGSSMLIAALIPELQHAQRPEEVLPYVGQMVAIMLPLLVVGAIITTIGVYATLIKYTVDEAVKECRSIQSQYPAYQPYQYTYPGPPAQVTEAKPIRVCPVCKSAVPEDAVFCPNCGAKLTGGAEETTGTGTHGHSKGI